jgi:hypothetical protein
VRPFLRCQMAVGATVVLSSQHQTGRHRNFELCANAAKVGGPPPNVMNCIYRARMSRSADDQNAEALRSAALRQDEIALVHEVFAEEHEAAAESLSGDLAEAHLGAAEKHLEAADDGRAQAQAAREEADTEHD